MYLKYLNMINTMQDNIKIENKDGVTNIQIRTRYIVSLIILVTGIFSVFIYDLDKRVDELTRIQANLALETMIVWDSNNLEITPYPRLQKDLDMCETYNIYYNKDYKAVKSCNLIKDYFLQPNKDIFKNK